MNRLLALLLAVIGVILLVVAVIYFVDSAHSLPSFIPGHIAKSTATAHRWKRGVAAAVVGVIVLILAVLAARPRRPPAPPAPA